jgi:hypothetical protein
MHKRGGVRVAKIKVGVTEIKVISRVKPLEIDSEVWEMLPAVTKGMLVAAHVAKELKLDPDYAGLLEVKYEDPDKPPGDVTVL